MKDPAYSQSTIAARGIDLVKDVKIPSTIKHEKEQKEEKNNQMITEHRYGQTYRDEVEVRKVREVKEFNDSIRSLEKTSGHGSVIPETVSEMIVEKLEESSQVFAKARKIPTVNGSVKIPRETSIGIASFVGEGQSLIEEAFSLGEVTLTQKRAGAYIALTNQLINDAAMDMADYCSNLLMLTTLIFSFKCKMSASISF